MTTGAGTALLYTYHSWPNATHASLWTAAINNYFNLIKSIPANLKPKNYHGRNKISATYDYSPLSIFSGSKDELSTCEPNSWYYTNSQRKTTVTRYIGATVFVDNYSYFTYVHLCPKLMQKPHLNIICRLKEFVIRMESESSTITHILVSLTPKSLRNH